MKIALITTGFAASENDYGGAAAILNLVKQLSINNDIELTVFSLYYPINQPEYNISNVKIFSFAKSGRAGRFEKFRIWKRCKKKFVAQHKAKPFDLIHSMWSGESGYVAAQLSRKNNLPLVTNINGGELGEIKEIKFGSRLKFFQKYFVDKTFKQAKAIVCGSEYILSLIKKHYSTDIRSKAKKIPFGIDEKQFSPSQKNYDNHSPVLINIANAAPVKSHIDLFKATEIVKRKFPGIVLNYYGKNEKGLLKKLAVQLGAENNVNLNQFIEYEKIPLALHNSDIFVLSSLYESQNMSIIEAAFCGLPVVSTAVGAAPEITPHVVNPGDYKSLAQKIIDVIENYPEEKQKALLKRDDLVNKYSLKNVSDGFISLYKSLL